MAGKEKARVRTVIRYSEAFKRQVVDEIARGKFSSLEAARRASSPGAGAKLV